MQVLHWHTPTGAFQRQALMPFAFFIIYHYCNQDFPLHPEETQTPNPTGPVRPGFPTDNNLCVPACVHVRAQVSLYQLETFFQQSKSVRADSAACCNNFQELERSSSTPSGNFASTSKKWGSGKVNMKQRSFYSLISILRELTLSETESADSCSVSAVCLNKHSKAPNHVFLHCYWQSCEAPIMPSLLFRQLCLDLCLLLWYCPLHIFVFTSFFYLSSLKFELLSANASHLKLLS